MLQRLKHWYYLTGTTAALASAFARAAWYFAVNGKASLAPLPRKSLTINEIRRWKHYFYGATYLRAVFSLLHRHSVSPGEMRLFANLSALAGFFDDLADAFRRRDQTGIRWQDNPEQYGQTADSSGRALQFLQNVYGGLPPEDLPQFKQFLNRVFNLETTGRQQSGQTLPPGELARLTAEKGGYSVLLFRRALRPPLPETEQQALFEFGALVQLCDDIFDLWFDRQNGTDTLATALAAQNDIEQLKCLFEHQVTRTHAAFRQTGFPHSRIERALSALHYLVSVTRSCLAHYLRLKKKSGSLPFNNRRAMVVDMGRWSNRFRAGLRVLLDSDAMASASRVD